MEKILICNALLVWENTEGVVMERFVYVAEDKNGYMLRSKIPGTEMDKIIEFLLDKDNFDTSLFSSDGKINLEFDPPVSSYAVFYGGCFGRTPYPGEVWELKELSQYQKRALLKEIRKKKSA